MGVTPEAFQEQVLEASHDTPILVDFWAPWCGPCQVLGPILDKLSAESAGQWHLYKVNTDESQPVAQSYQIRGIPAVKLFVDGEVTAEFSGALSEPMVRHWLQEHLPTPSRTALANALKLMAAGRASEAEPILRQALDDDVENEHLRIRLAQVLALSDIKEATELTKSPSSESDLAAVAAAINTVSDFANRELDSLPDGPGRSYFVEALRALHAGDHESVINQLILVLQHDRYYLEDAARKFGVALFAVMGPGHAITQQYRRTFDMWLY